MEEKRTMEVHVRGFRERSRVRTSGCDGAC